MKKKATPKGKVCSSHLVVRSCTFNLLRRGKKVKLKHLGEMDDWGGFVYVESSGPRLKELLTIYTPITTFDLGDKYEQEIIIRGLIRPGSIGAPDPQIVPMPAGTTRRIELVLVIPRL